MGFIIGTLIIALSCSAVTIKTLIGYNHFNLLFKIFVALIVLLGCFAPLWLNWLRRSEILPPVIFSWVYNAGYFLFGFCFLLFVVIILRDFLWFLSFRLNSLTGWNVASWDPKAPALLAKANLASVGLTLLISAWAVFEALKMPAVKTITLTSPKVDKEYRFVLLNDLHLTRSSPLSRLQKMVDLVNGLKPDAVFMAGDIIDDRVDRLEPEFKILEQLHAPLGIYASTGNHELYNGLDMWRRRFKRMGINVLINQGSVLPGTRIYIGAIPDLNTAMLPMYHVDLPKTFADSRANDYRILLSHNPDLSKYKYDSYDLQLSGHTHGGQIWPFHYLAWKANKYLAGEFKLPKGELYLSRGAGYWGPPMRLFAPAEITEIILKPQK